MEGSNWNVAIVALGPIPFFWLATFILLFVMRAQLIGFRAVVSWGALPQFKKLFVVFCAFFSLATVLFVATMVLNLYADSKVPVGLSPFLHVMRFGNDQVFAEGTGPERI